MDTSDNKIAGRIKKLMNEKNISIDDIVTNTIIKRASIKRYLNGDVAKMRQTEIASISNYFGVSPAYVIGWQDYRELVYTLKGEEPVRYKNTTRQDSDIDFFYSLIGKGIIKVEEID